MSNAEAPKRQTLKETIGERWFDGDAKTIRVETWRFLSKVVSLAVLWVGSKTYQRQFGRILTSKECSRRNILLVGLAIGWLNTDKKTCRWHCIFPRHSFRSGIGKLQVCKHSSNWMVTIQLAEGLMKHFLSEQKGKAWSLL